MATELTTSLYQTLSTYQPFDEREASDLRVFLAYLEQFPTIFDRSNLFAHVTASPWIVNESRDKVLMIYHNIYRSWGWCGGHCDGDHDTIAVALKEGKEETGLTKLTLLSKHILGIDVLPVPPHVKNGKFISAHVHLNVTYACLASEKEPLRMKPDENSGVAWVRIEDIHRLVTEEDMKPVYDKLNKKLSLY